MEKVKDIENIKLPEKWSEWTIVEKLGEGGQGAVYKAVCNKSGRELYSAIKSVVIKSKSELDEIKLMYELKGSSNIIFIEDYYAEKIPDKREWQVYIRMEYLQSLEDILRNHSVSEAEVIRIAIDICKALEQCEINDIVHRDIKEGNIFLSNYGIYKLGDFGISGRVTASDRNGGGSLLWMAPETYHSKRCNAQTDLYSLGMVMYRMMNDGLSPFMDKNKSADEQEKQRVFNLRVKEGEELPALQKASKDLNAVILKLCEYNPKERYQSAKELRIALESISKKKQKRRKMLLTILAVVTGLTAAISVIYYGNMERKNARMVDIKGYEEYESEITR